MFLSTKNVGTDANGSFHHFTNVSLKKNIQYIIVYVIKYFLFDLFIS